MTPSTLERLRAAASGYQHSSILAAMAELDLCTAIAENNNSMSAPVLAKQKNCDPRGIAVLLDALAAMGYLDKKGLAEEALYSVAEAYKEYLDSRRPGTFIPMIRHMANGIRAWSRLTWTVRDGTLPERLPSILGAEEDRMSFILGMNSIAHALAGPTVRAMLDAGVLSFAAPDIRFLDIGGASGTYTWAFLEALPRSRGAIFDLPVGIRAARKRFDGSEFESRVEMFTGDFYEEDLPGGFDFAWISAIIHQHGREESRALYTKTFRALNPGGKVAVRDFIMNEQRTAPPAGAFFGVNMLLATSTGMVYTYKEVEEDLRAAGFIDIRLAVPEESMSAVVVGMKPE